MSAHILSQQLKEGTKKRPIRSYLSRQLVFPLVGYQHRLNLQTQNKQKEDSRQLESKHSTLLYIENYIGMS